MTTAKDLTAPADVQRWSEELARNPASLAFLPLARAYRRQGRLDAALRLCLRGLEQHPMHVEAHALLALLHLESGDRARAADEWATVLRLKPGNFEALRGMGFRYLEEGDVGRARQHLERAALIRPMDTAVQEALRLLRSQSDERVSIHTEPPAPAQPSMGAGTAGRFSLVEQEAAEVFGGGRGAETAEDAEGRKHHTESRRHAEFSEAHPVGLDAQAGEDPTQVFDGLLRGGPVTGVLLLDGRGFVLAGRLSGTGEAQADEVGALIGGTAEEVARTVQHLDLRSWRGTVLECGRAVLHVSPVEEDGMLVVALRRNTPHGWIVRAASQAGSMAADYLRRMR